MTKIRITYVPGGGPRKPGWQAYHPSWGSARAVEGNTLDDLMNAICYGTLRDVPVARSAPYDDYPDWYLSYRFGDNE
jgi:hypothetical protein